MDKFLETYNLPRLIHEKNQTSEHIIKEGQWIHNQKTPQQRKHQDQVNSLVNSTEHPSN